MPFKVAILHWPHPIVGSSYLLLNIRIDFVLFPSEIEDPKMKTSTKKQIDIDHKSRWKFTCSGRSRCKPQPGQGPWCWGRSADPVKANLGHCMSEDMIYAWQQRQVLILLVVQIWTWMPRRICLTVMAGRQSFSSSKMERQTCSRKLMEVQPWARQGVKQKTSINIRAYRATGVDIWVEERGHKLDLKWALSCKY